MKFTDKIPKKKYKPVFDRNKLVEQDYTESEARVMALMPLALHDWYNIHNQCHKGMTTGAYLGMQWSCPDYHNVICGCGSSAIMKSIKSKVVIERA